MRSFALLLLFAFIACQAEKDTISEKEIDPKEKIQALIYQYESLNRFKGQVVIADSDSIFFDWATKGLEDARFPMGQLSESILGILALRLESKGKLDLNESIAKVLPDCHNCKGLHYRRLLRHQSGLESIDSIRARFPEELYGPIKFANLSKKKKKAQPSQLNYNLLSKALERKYQYAIGDLLKSNLGKPFSTSAKQFPLFIQKYDRDSQKIVLQTKNKILKTSPTYLYGATGLELVKFYQNMFFKGGLDSMAITVLVENPSNRPQFGFYIDRDSSTFFLQNTSYSPTGHEAQVLIDIKKSRIFLLSNFVDKRGIATELLQSIYTILEGDEVMYPLHRKTSKVKQDSLGKIVGIYESDGFRLSIVENDSSLLAKWSGGSTPLVQQDVNQFFLLEKDASITFFPEGKKAVFYPGLLEGDTLKKVE